MHAGCPQERGGEERRGRGRGEEEENDGGARGSRAEQRPSLFEAKERREKLEETDSISTKNTGPAWILKTLPLVGSVIWRVVGGSGRRWREGRGRRRRRTGGGNVVMSGSVSLTLIY
ncbi:hypothetical protein GWI33_022232 [Rhynchophorus ferrugineus]|uniref:Uncharacterized protein n=1 Tax=Rhynchophorus ferrugineus TaxID=354439 RepID=A0A834LZD2_RHYFE|nr:hypothetical protein GWI33_022236 [Rhynchophorus ferrugineus]KAF7264827.1 hypothetical protein GWI33_022232 [Rhynchophorus ferrugineus]